MHMFGWSQGLKTGMYYLRSKPAVNAIKFTVESNPKSGSMSANEFRKLVEQSRVAAEAEDDDCLMCGS